MSRTDKDVPDWYSAYYEPFHRCRMGYGWYHSSKDCNLPELTWNAVRPNRPKRKLLECEWHPARPADRKHWYNDNPGWWYRIVWLEPERTRVRDQSRKALQDYNANGDTDVDIADYRKKHNGGWYW